MKKFIFTSIALLSLFTGFSQSGDENQQTRNVSGFRGVETSGGIDLYLTSGPESVSVSASSTTVRDHMVTEVIDGILRIHLQKNWHGGFGNPHMKAYVTISKLEKLGASGGGDITLRNEITGSDIATIRRQRIFFMSEKYLVGFGVVCLCSYS